MQNTDSVRQKDNGAARLITVWDFPTRLFHWLLVILIVISFVTGNIGGNAMQYHKWSGFTILVLILFRLIWGFVGSRESRFATFVRAPSAVVGHAKALLRRDSPRHLGHNPLGGWSIMAMLLALLVQAVTGLFANDDIATQGPLYDWVSKATSDGLTRIHRLNQEVILALVSIHILAVLFYFFYKRENLVMPMITGVKQWSGPEPEAPAGRTWLAAAITALAAIAVYLLVGE